MQNIYISVIINMQRIINALSLWSGQRPCFVEKQNPYKLLCHSENALQSSWFVDMGKSSPIKLYW